MKKTVDSRQLAVDNKTCKQFFVKLFAGALLLLSFQIMQAHGGEDHGDAPKPKAVAKDYFSTEAVSDVYELLLKYVPIKAGEATHLTIFVSDYNTNKPVNDATLQISSPDDDTMKFEVKRKDKGVYEVHTSFKEKKIYSLNISINSSLGADLLQLPNIEVGKELPHAVETAAKPATGNWVLALLFAGGFVLALLLVFIIGKVKNKKTFSVLLFAFCLLPLSYAHEGHDDAPGNKGNNFSTSFLVPKETQFLFEVFTQKIETGDFTESTKLFGTVIPSSNGQAIVTTPQSGKINSLNVNVGQTVSKGQLLAVVEQNIDAGTQVNLLSEKNNVDAEFEASKKNYDRLKAIEDIAAKKDVAEAEARFRKAEENKKLFENLLGNNSSNSKLIFLKSPISGVVGSFTFSIGSTVNANETILTVTNLSKVYVEAQVFDRDVENVKAGKTFTIESTNNHKTAQVKLLSLGQSINATNQSQRVLFEIENQNSDFKIGEFVNIRVFAGKAKQEISVPNSAINEMNGKPIVFLKDAAETYSLVYVNTGENNGSFTTIKNGIEDGERVVVNGTYQMKMIYLNQ